MPHASTSTPGRITTLDAIRGVAVLGILLMNAVSFGLGTAPYFNIGAGDPSRLDLWIGAAGEVLVDQKFMALFSLLFGAGIALFAERARLSRTRGGSLALSLWRNALLLVIGFLHGLLWDGDVLIVYAICAPVVILLRRLPVWLLIVAGCATLLLSPLAALAAQTTVDVTGSGLGEYWFDSSSSTDAATSPTAAQISDPVGLFLYADFFSRALGMMLIGVALFRTGIITGAREPAYYRRLAKLGLGLGLPLSIAGVTWVVATGFSPSVALVGSIPNTLATLPVALGYLALIALWNQRAPATALHNRVHAVGRMALTNYIVQSLIGIALLRTYFDPVDLSRAWILTFVAGVWTLQLAWSKPWLQRFRYGPLEWLWRSATHRALHPLRR